MGKNLYKKRRKQIGILLQLERKCQKLEQEDIAEALGVRQEFISKIEAGTRRIDILELIEYCEALNFYLSEFSWKIETKLSALSLLPLPKTNILGRKIRVEVSWSDNRFSATFVDIVPETLVFNAEIFAELLIKVKDGLDAHLKEMAVDGNKVPMWLVNKEYDLEYIFLDATSLLRAYVPFLSLAVISRVSGINQNQLSQYANGLKKARPNQVKRIIEAIHEIGKELMAAEV